MTTPAPSSPAAPAAPAATAQPKPPKILRDSAIIPLLLIGMGGYLMWFGVKYWRGTGPAAWPSFPVKSVLQGKGLPAPEPAVTAEVTLSSYEQSVAGTIGSGGSPGGTIDGSAIATDALRYAGHPYKWGGARPDGWDCSGFVNWVIGHDLGLHIPGM